MQVNVGQAMSRPEHLIHQAIVDRAKYHATQHGRDVTDESDWRAALQYVERELLNKTKRNAL